MLGCHVFVRLADPMHAVDEGPTTYLSGSSSFYVIFMASWGWGSVRDEKRLRLFREVAKGYATHGPNSRLTNIEFYMVGVDPKAPRASTPELKTKAVESKHLVPILLDASEEHGKCKTVECEGHMLQALKSLNACYDNLDYRCLVGGRLSC